MHQREFFSQLSEHDRRAYAKDFVRADKFVAAPCRPVKIVVIHSQPVIRFATKNVAPYLQAARRLLEQVGVHRLVIRGADDSCAQFWREPPRHLRDAFVHTDPRSGEHDAYIRIWQQNTLQQSRVLEKLVSGRTRNVWGFPGAQPYIFRVQDSIQVKVKNKSANMPRRRYLENRVRNICQHLHPGVRFFIQSSFLRRVREPAKRSAGDATPLLSVRFDLCWQHVPMAADFDHGSKNMLSQKPPDDMTEAGVKERRDFATDSKSGLSTVAI